ncbi:MBL fold metallo-hydrolase [Halobacillus sp. Nhm2S1]|uniref:MBL fold metallo-hydrolase n=1 Tax=Halobacillus sp. Nhm2S1 TaxID=2866716 RepID=UPI001C72FDD7|nr:MBL fold metallo-hydrolase [Halobacillus sp. Nhm2S1]MBX0359449.1 MBL fold metallo-hydrolase [Halobacillus sp. Nhm2S1]
MRVQYIASACVLIEHANIKVLCDPWLKDGTYYGSWYHYPPLKHKPEDFFDVDYIYISHIHPDHMDLESLKSFPRDIPILIHDYAEKFILKILKGIGFERIIEISHYQVYPLAENFTIEILSADNCDPELCGKFFGCSVLKPYNKTIQIDTLAVFDGSGKTVVNTNDCPYPLSYKVCDYIKQKYNSIDFLMVGYAGAGPFPQCFENLSETEKLKKGEAKQNQFLRQAINYLNHLKPEFFMPFAGQYTLGGKLAKLNKYRGVPVLEELEDLFAPLIKSISLEGEKSKESGHSKMVLLNRGEWFDVETKRPTASFTPSSSMERERYINEVLKKKKFTYEQDEHVIEKSKQKDLTNDLVEAQKKMLSRQDKEGGYRSHWRIYIDAGQDFIYCIPYNGDPVQRVGHGKEIEPYVRITVDYSLLNMILNRKAHWNNAEIGSHLKYYRKPDVFERGIHHFLSYLHC